MKIIVTRRIADYHACVEGHPEICGCGETRNEAIGELIRSHQDMFRIVITHK